MINLYEWMYNFISISIYIIIRMVYYFIAYGSRMEFDGEDDESGNEVVASGSAQASGQANPDPKEDSFEQEEKVVKVQTSPTKPGRIIQS